MPGSAIATRARIVAAAEELVIRDGVSKLTLEKAASEAGISKGGVLYHFPSRAALVSAMVQRFVESFDDDLERYGALGGRPGDFTRAYLNATVHPTPRPGDLDVRERRLGGALLAGVASDAELLAPLRERFSLWQKAVEDDGLDAAVATLVRLVVDGMWLSDLFELAPLEGQLREDVAAAAFRLVEEATRP